MSELDIPKLLSTAFGPVTGSILAVILLVVGGRFIKPTLAGADATSQTIKTLQEERDKAHEERDEHKAEVDRLTALYHETKEQNALLKMYMRLNFNATDADFIKAGVRP